MLYVAVILSANYRSHKALINYSSDIFYKGMLRAGGTQPQHPHYHPLSFIAARGESVQRDHGTGYYNLAEVSCFGGSICVNGCDTQLVKAS